MNGMPINHIVSIDHGSSGDGGNGFGDGVWAQKASAKRHS